MRTAAEKPTATRETFDRVFREEWGKRYKLIDDLETVVGYHLSEARLLDAARVLACPVKRNPPNWQHGRVLYALARHYLAEPCDQVRILDIGTAKGFSALCLAWAIHDSGLRGTVVSCDVIDPAARVRRNTVAEVDGLRTLAETVRPWRDDLEIVSFVRATGVEVLEANPERINFAFVDGKHSGHEVIKEGRLLAKRQQAGDLAVFDDVHLPDVHQAVMGLEGAYKLAHYNLLPQRAYAIGVRR
jgi:predicted O-methyltransferase YrrM